MPDIFLSYNREDQSRAKVFAEAFAAQGFSVWWDVGLKTGEAYDEVTEAALRGAKAVVVLWSKRSVQSRWVRAEATLADRNKTLVPCMIEPCERPIMFELTQTAELSHWSGDAQDRAWAAFVADVRRFVGREPSPPFAAPTQKLAQIARAPEPVETILAVLAFDNQSADAEMGFFSDGVSEEILTQLSRGSKLKVIGKTSSFQFRGAEKAKAAVTLKASHVVDGSIRRAGAKVRVSAHLTEAASGANLWSERYDRGLDDIFAVQDEIAQAIAEALSAALRPTKTAAVDPEAYDLYLRSLANDGDTTSGPKQIEFCEAAVAKDPTFAAAWSRLAFWRMMHARHVPLAERPAIHAATRADIARARALAPANQYYLMAEHFLLDPFGQQLAARAVMRQMEAAIASGRGEPNFSVHLGTHAREVGRVLHAIDILRHALALDPQNLAIAGTYSTALFHAGRLAEARLSLERCAERWPNSHHIAASRVMLYAHQKDWAAVDEALDPARLERYPLREHSGVVWVAGAMRDTSGAAARAVFGIVQGRAEKTGHIDPSVALYFAHLGLTDEIYALLDRCRLGPAGGPHDTMGISAYSPQLLFQAPFPELVNDPRFVKLAARLGLVEYWLATQDWPDCADTVPYDFRAECEKHRDYPTDKFFG